MMRCGSGVLLALYGSLAIAAAPAAVKVEPSRGELLYTTYCVACHTEQVHWRDKKLVANWKSLVAEVDRWQANGKLEWSRNDIEQVSRYLNAIHYHYRVRSKLSVLEH